MAPDGRWAVFDRLGHVYRLPIEGGTATNLTEGSGNALHFHPAISRDGASIAFISDRLEQRLGHGRRW
ncbi:MAG: TolB family protein [Gemmatimonadaceae bacterium]